MDGGPDEPVCMPPIGIEAFDDRVDVAEGNAGGVGVAPVGDHLDIGGLVGCDSALEVLADPDDKEGATIVDEVGDVAGAVDPGDLLEHARAVEPGDQVMSGGAAILVEDRIGDVVEVVGGGIAEEERLEDRRQKQRHPAARILQHREQLLARQGEDAEERIEDRGHQASFFCVAIRASSMSPAAIPASTAALGRITLQTSPARKMVCSSATK